MPAPRVNAYVICATPRTGSTLLCSLLKSTGVAGKPESFFRSQDSDQRAQDWNICHTDGSYDFEDFLQAAVAAGQSPNGVFGVRIMWETMAELINRLRPAGSGDRDIEVLSSAFGPIQFVYLYRRDVVAQAVSRVKAEQTQVWHLTGDSTQHRANSEIHYDREQISHFVEETNRHNAAWELWFKDNGIEPLCLSYEDLNRDNASETRRVLDHLRLDAADSLINAGNTRMADSINKEWIERFEAEGGASLQN